jgi:WhiB family redox-sensing transcriptional regulator
VVKNRVNQANQAGHDKTSQRWPINGTADAAEDEWLTDTAMRLERVRSASDDALGAAVVGAGSCLDAMSDGDRPGWLFDNDTDPDVAAQVCAQCPVQDECLELELRLFGARKLGMWGVLGEDGRCALHTVWVGRRGGEIERLVDADGARS